VTQVKITQEIRRAERQTVVGKATVADLDLLEESSVEQRQLFSDV